MRKPWYRKANKTWYVTHNKKQVNLGKDKDAAFDEYHRLMAGQQDASPKMLLADLIGQFLDWCQQHRDKKTYDWYRLYLKSFVEFVGKHRRVSQIRTYHATNWIDQTYGKKSESARHNAARSVKRMFNWAMKQDRIERNPVRGLEVKTPEPREVYIDASQWQRVLDSLADTDPFKEFLLILKETGCRPHEARMVEARHFDRERQQWVFPETQSKGGKRKRVVPLNDRAFEITQRLALKHPDGKLFRNSKGEAWTKYSIGNRFRRLSKELGFHIFAYAIRHTFITDALLKKVHPMTLAIIVGHKDASMIMKTYSHLNLHQDHIREELKKATA